MFPPPNTAHKIIFLDSIEISSSMNLFRLTNRSVHFTQNIKPKILDRLEAVIARGACTPPSLMVRTVCCGVAKSVRRNHDNVSMKFGGTKKQCTNPWHFRWTCINKSEETQGTWNCLAPYGATGWPLRAEAADWRTLCVIDLGSTLGKLVVEVTICLTLTKSQNLRSWAPKWPTHQTRQLI